MSAKNLDAKGRWRNITIAFRTTPQEAYRIDMLAKISGYTKQEYITKRLLCEEVVVHPNCRIQKYLSHYLVELTEELKRLQHVGKHNLPYRVNSSYGKIRCVLHDFKTNSNALSFNRQSNGDLINIFIKEVLYEKFNLPRNEEV